MPDTPASRYEAYLGFFFLGIIGFVISILAGWFETLYAVMFFLAGINLVFTSTRPQPDPTHSADTHFEIYSRDNVFNYILAVILVLEALIYFALPISKPLVILGLWALNVFAYPRLVDFFSSRLAGQIVGSYLLEQLPELSAAQVNQSVTRLNSDPDTSADALATDYNFSAELAARLIAMYHKYLERSGL